MTNPNAHTLTCDEFAERLADFLERDLPEAGRAAMDAHAVSCADCGPLLADLRRLRLDATNLPELAPSRDLWTGIAERIETPVVALGSAREFDGSAEVIASRGARIATKRRSAAWLSLAAAGLVALTATGTYLMTKRSLSAPGSASTTVASSGSSTEPGAILTSPPDSASGFARQSAGMPAGASPDRSTPAGNSAARAARSGAATPLSLASNAKVSPEATYDLEISRLRRIVNQRRSQLDSTTVTVIEKNLRIIDEAIAQCRLALKKDPASDFLMESLNQALDNKVQLLRTAAGLPARM